MTRVQHHWLYGGSTRDRESVVSSLLLAPALAPTVDAHRRLRGPYTAGGTLLRAVVPQALAMDPSLPARHDVEILAAAPELRGLVPLTRETLTSSSVGLERTRFYGGDRTTQLAHGITEFLRGYLTLIGEPRSLVVSGLEHADPTDAELISIMLRRIDPALLTLVICTAGDEIEQPLGEALSQYASRELVLSEAGEDSPTGNTGESANRTLRELAGEYVASECLADDAGLSAAYAAIEPELRAELHDRRADELEARDEFSLRLGAILFHRERGSDFRGAGLRAFDTAIKHCSQLGFYGTTLELTTRVRPLVDWSEYKLCHMVAARMALSLIMTGRPAEAEAIYWEAKRHSTEPATHMTFAYDMAMLYTRHYEPALLDHLKAKAFVNQAIAFAKTITDPVERAFRTVFMENGLALVETHLRNHAEALRLVVEGAARLDAELAPEEHRLHRTVLIHNRSQVRVGMGQLEAALADLTEVIDKDPNYAPYRFDRAGVWHRLGRDEEALADYEEALRLAPAMFEGYYNRAEVRAGLGDLEGALADFDHTLELNPRYLPAYINRAGLHVDLGNDELARRDVADGLRLEPDNAHLLAISGQLHAAVGNVPAALEAYDRAVAADPNLQAAWAGRASLVFERGDLTGALNDLDRALELGDSAGLRFNRAIALIAADRWDDALIDLNRALELDPEDVDSLQARDRCTHRQQAAANS